jgi:hypothetical protein
VRKRALENDRPPNEAAIPIATSWQDENELFGKMQTVWASKLSGLCTIMPAKVMESGKPPDISSALAHE